MANRRTHETVDAARDRAMADRPATEVREYTDEEREALYRSGHAQGVLPSLPRIDGFHTVWLSTSSKADSIQHRMRFGYVPIKPSDIPGWDMAEMHVGKYQGQEAITWEEMIAFKISLDDYAHYMRFLHDTRPREIESGITGNLQHLRPDVGSETNTNTDGFRQLGSARRPGDFKRRDLEPGFQRPRY